MSALASLFSSLVPAHRKGERNFERARKAEQRGDFAKAEAYFNAAAEGFDAHFAARERKGGRVRASRLAMAGICYTRLGRNQEAIDILQRALEQRDIPDAYLNAGYAAAKLGDRDTAIRFWAGYPDWADQAVIASALKEQLDTLREGGDLQTACEAVARAVREQDRRNVAKAPFVRHNREKPPHRGY